MNEFSWIPAFKAIAEWLSEYRNRQPELVSLLKSVGITSGLDDIDLHGNPAPLEEIDPFTFFCLFTKFGPDTRAKLLARFIEVAKLPIIPPHDFNGVPSANAQKVWMFPFKSAREAWMIPALWDLFEEAKKRNIEAATFDRCLKIPNTGFTKLTECLFYVAPEHYFPVDGQTRPWLKGQGIDAPASNWKSYAEFLSKLRATSDKPFSAISHEAWLSNQLEILTKEDALALLDARYQGTRTGTAHIAAWRAPGGRQMAMDPGPKKIVLFVDSPPPAPDFSVVEPYPPEKPRNHHLKQHAPELAQGKQAYAVSISSGAQLEGLCNWYDTQSATSSQAISPKASEDTLMSDAPLNQILFGPPGTGKTYNTVNRTLEILDPVHLSKFKGNRAELNRRFRELSAEHRVRFVTFHQSFSYEDFVEGLRAETDGDDNLVYKVEPGVFKQLCDVARGLTDAAKDVGIAQAPRIWKLSIDGTRPSSTRDHCFANGEARIGWGDVGDLTDLEMGTRAKFEALGTHDRNTLQNFAHEVDVGDVVLCIRSSDEVQAIGVVQGPYRYDSDIPSGVRKDYPNVLPVRWLATGLNLNLRELNGGVRFTLKTLYELTRINWPDLARTLEKAGIALTGSASSGQAGRDLPHVLIIDEINRGNISRIFGELITLIEPSKRDGADEAIEVILPYSKTRFSVPRNVHLIGTMNTADRSLAGLDVALRRRFQFIAMPPSIHELRGIVVDGVPIDAMIQGINDRIECLLGREFQLGHAYFLSLRNGGSLSALSKIFRQQILPLLQEYFFEDWQRIAWVLSDELKQPTHRFVVSKEVGMEGLPEHEGPSAKTLWAIDDGAFDKIESYHGIKPGAVPA